MAEQDTARRTLAFRDQTVRVRAESVRLAEEAARVVRDRYGLNLVSLVDVLQAEAEVAGQRRALATAEVDVWRARLDVAFAGAQVPQKVR